MKAWSYIFIHHRPDFTLGNWVLSSFLGRGGQLYKSSSTNAQINNLGVPLLWCKISLLSTCRCHHLTLFTLLLRGNGVSGNWYSYWSKKQQSAQIQKLCICFQDKIINAHIKILSCCKSEFRGNLFFFFKTQLHFTDFQADQVTSAVNKWSYWAKDNTLILFILSQDFNRIKSWDYLEFQS